MPLKLWAQTTRLLPPLHITSRQNNNKRRINGDANAPHKRSPIPLASLSPELVPPNRDQEPAAAHLPCPAERAALLLLLSGIHRRASAAGHSLSGIHRRPPLLLPLLPPLARRRAGLGRPGLPGKGPWLRQGGGAAPPGGEWK